MTFRPPGVLLILTLLSTPVFAQATRAELVEQQRAARAQTLAPYQPGKIERALLYVEDTRFIERIGAGLSGVYPRFGGFTTGSGLSLGVGYLRSEPTSPLVADLSGAISLRGYKALDLRAGTPRLWQGRLSLMGSLRWWDYTRERYYGLGSDSQNATRTSFAYEAVQLQGQLRMRPKRWWSFGNETTYLRPDIKAGTDSRFPSIEAAFTDDTAPGLARPPRMMANSTFIDVDYRDQPANTRSGGRYLVRWGVAWDLNPGQEFNHRRAEITLEQVIPVFDKKRNFAVRIQGAHVDPLQANGRVPFFLTPTIGGSDSIRSYRDARFRGASYILINGEYRWEAFSGLDLALFWDGGDVGTTLEEVRLKELKTGYGFGLRFNTNRSVFMRFDVGFGSSEGTRVFLKFGPAL